MIFFKNSNILKKSLFVNLIFTHKSINFFFNLNKNFNLILTHITKLMLVNKFSFTNIEI